MQKATKIQNSIDHSVQHQDTKAAVLQEQLAGVTRNKNMAECELAKFRVLREGLNVATNVLNQQFDQFKKQEAPSPVTMAGFDGALGHLSSLVTQAATAIAKNEGSFMAFQAMEVHLTEQMTAATSKGRTVAAQGAKAVQVAEQGEAGAKSVADLISSADDEPAPAPIASAKKKTASKKRGRRKSK